MNYLFLFIPAIGWGLMPLFVAGVKKSNIYHQIVGSVLGVIFVRRSRYFNQASSI